MFKWEKLGLIFDPSTVTNPYYMHEFAQAPNVLVFDSFVRVFFSCRPKPDKQGRYVSYSTYIDLDRNDLSRILRISPDPILPLGETGTFDEFGIYPCSVIKVDDQIYLYYGGWTRCESVPFNVSIGMGVSDDNGRCFKKVGKGPILSFSKDEPFIISGPKITRFNGIFYLWYIAGRKWILDRGKPEPVYKIRMAMSKDGFIWEKANRDLIESRIEPDEAQASPDVFQSNGRYHMFFCYRYSTDYRNGLRGYRIGYARSDDLCRWKREDEKVGIGVSSEGWDSQMISYPHVFELDGQIYMLYLGNDVGRHGFGLAKLHGELS